MNDKIRMLQRLMLNEKYGKVQPVCGYMYADTDDKYELNGKSVEIVDISEMYPNGKRRVESESKLKLKKVKGGYVLVNEEEEKEMKTHYSRSFSKDLHELMEEYKIGEAEIKYNMNDCSHPIISSKSIEQVEMERPQYKDIDENFTLKYDPKLAKWFLESKNDWVDNQSIEILHLLEQIYYSVPSIFQFIVKK